MPTANNVTALPTSSPSLSDHDQRDRTARSVVRALMTLHEARSRALNLPDPARTTALQRVAEVAGLLEEATTCIDGGQLGAEIRRRMGAVALLAEAIGRKIG
jgi:hypothetical protein